MNLLFVCSRNQWRSPTAENVFRNREGVQARSAGTENSSRIRISKKMISWADLIFVMEKKHKIRLIEKFPDVIREKRIVILDIPDEYQYMDAELIEILKI